LQLGSQLNLITTEAQVLHSINSHNRSLAPQRQKGKVREVIWQIEAKTVVCQPEID